MQSLRKWTASIFVKHPVLTSKYITKLQAVPSVGGPRGEGRSGIDFDVQVKILQLFKVDEYMSEIRVIDDSGEIWHSSVYNIKYRSIKQGQYVRIRAASLANHLGYSKTFGMRPYSNILTLPYPCKLAESMMFDEQAESRGFEQTQLSSGSTLMHPIIVSDIKDNKVCQQEVLTLSQVPNNDGKVHNVRFSVSHTTLANDAAKSVKVKEASGEIKPSTKSSVLKKGQEFATCLQLFVKDSSQQQSNMFTRVNVVCTSQFFGIKPKDLLLQDERATKQLKESIQRLERFNVWVQASV